MTEKTAERRVTAYLDNDTSRNVIHSPEEAKRLGYEGGLVTGVVVFGWAVPAVVEVLGAGWLDRGWTEFRFRRPVYGGGQVHASIRELELGAADVEISREGDERCVVGGVGLGTASWFEEIEDLLASSEQARKLLPQSRVSTRSPTCRSAKSLLPRAVPVSIEDAATIAARVRDDDPR